MKQISNMPFVDIVLGIWHLVLRLIEWKKKLESSDKVKGERPQMMILFFIL